MMEKKVSVGDVMTDECADGCAVLQIYLGQRQDRS